MKLVFPTYKYKKSYEELIQSAKNNNDLDFIKTIYDDKISFSQILKKTNKNRQEQPIFWIILHEIVIGFVELDLVKSNLFCYIKKEQRHKGYATKAVSLVIEKMQELKISKILIECEKNNFYWEKVIISNHGTLLKTDKEIKIYSINI